ncbi:hypothetical protein AB0M02_37115 [Actinoplanes sp. NPDC051861]|uniref:hypothetical protein n=1 Tax=Actinoplanes sp. NPDC051861 TaxID=3155170 RepID=UPI003433D58E
MKVGTAGLVAGLILLVLLQRLEDAGADNGLAAAITVLLITGALLVASHGLGPLALRLTGALVAALGFAIYQWQDIKYVLPSAWSPAVDRALLIAAAAGLLALVVGGGFHLAALAGAFGLLAMITLVMTWTTVFGFGSTEHDVLEVFSTACASLALVCGLAVLRPGWLVALAAAAGAVVTAYVGYRNFPVYGTTAHRVLVWLSVAGGALGSLGVAGWTLFRRTSPPTEPAPPGADPTPSPPSASPEPETESRPVPPPQAAPPQAAPPPAAPPQASPPPAAPSPAAPSPVASSEGRPAEAAVATASAVPATPGRWSLQNIAVMVGVVSGVIGILKELIALVTGLTQ